MSGDLLTPFSNNSNTLVVLKLLLLYFPLIIPDEGTFIFSDLSVIITRITLQCEHLIASKVVLILGNKIYPINKSYFYAYKNTCVLNLQFKT